MIYQPTNVTPDLLGGAENGNVFVNAGGNVEVSWNVNGSSPLVAYQIDFFKMGSGSTPGGTTGKVVLDAPFSAVDAYGNVTRFSASVPYALFGQAAFQTNEGKFRITQWWGDTDGESVVQRSLSVYRVVRPPAVSVAGPSGFGGIYTFTGTVTLPSSGYGPVTAEWARWYAWNVTRQRTEQDTGKIYGTTGYEWTTLRLNPGDEYYVVFSVGMSYGGTYSAQTGTFTAMEGYIETTSALKAVCGRKQGGVRVDVTASEAVTAQTGGSWRFNQNGELVLEMGASASWNVPEVSGEQWSFAWFGTLNQAQSLQTLQNLVTVRQTDGNEFSVKIDPDVNGLVTSPDIFGGDQVRMRDGDQITVGLVESNGNFNFTLHTFHNGQNENSYTFRLPGDYSAPVASVTLGENTVTAAWIITWGADSNLLWQAVGTAEAPDIEGPQVILRGERYSGTADGDALYFGLYNAGADNPGFTMMRRDEDGNVVFVANIVYGEDEVPVSVWDYGAGNGHRYTYFVTNQAAADSQAFVNSSAEVTPCLWDWALVQTGPENREGVNGRFQAQQIFLFSANVSTGGIGNGNTPSVQSTFTRYPAVLRDSQNRQGGTLTGLIGTVQAGVYADSNQVRDAILALGTSTLPLFLRSRRGDFLRVAISGEITMTTTDNTPKQQISASIPWVEIGPVEDTAVTVEFQTPEGGGGK